jgi:hypothetical protein
MACFPQVLFVGAFLPVPAMAVVGRWISYAMTNRWAFEALGHSMGVTALWANGRSPLGPPLLASYSTTFGRAVFADWLILAGFTAAFLAVTAAIVARRTSVAGRQVRSAAGVPSGVPEPAVAESAGAESAAVEPSAGESAADESSAAGSSAAEPGR